MMTLEDFDVLPAHEVPVRYDGVSGDAVALTGSVPDLNDDTTDDDPVVGSGPELGGQESTAATYGSTHIATGLTDPDTVNLTGMSESPMTPNPSGPNVNGSGSPSAQQVRSRALSSQAVQLAANSTLAGISHFGNTVADNLFAPRKSTAPTVLMQTNQKGLNFTGNLVLFFIIGVILAMVIFE